MPTTRPPRLFLRWSTTRCSKPGCFCFHDALRNLCGAFLLCACTQQILGASQPCAAKRGGGFPLQCVLGVAALLSPTHFLRASVGLSFICRLDARRFGRVSEIWITSPPRLNWQWLF